MPKEIKDLKEFIKIMRREKKHLPKAEKITINKEQMPKEIKDLKEFIKIMRREKKHLPKAEKITIKKNSVTKFKLRTPKFLYTLMVNDITRAEKIMQSIPPNLKKEQPNQKTSA